MNLYHVHFFAQPGTDEQDHYFKMWGDVDYSLFITCSNSAVKILMEQAPGRKDLWSLYRSTDQEPVGWVKEVRLQDKPMHF